MKRTNKIIAVLAVLVAGSMIVGAALVPYLSNAVTTEVTVSSPMEQEISESPWSGYTTGPITFSDVHGGETVTFYVKTENKADATITGNASNIVINYDGLTDDDFSLVRARTYSGGLWSDWYTLTGSPINGWTVEFAYGPNPIIWAAGQIDITQVEVTFEEAASGVYTFTSQIIP